MPRLLAASLDGLCVHSCGGARRLVQQLMAACRRAVCIASPPYERDAGSRLWALQRTQLLNPLFTSGSHNSRMARSQGPFC